MNLKDKKSPLFYRRPLCAALGTGLISFALSIVLPPIAKLWAALVLLLLFVACACGKLFLRFSHRTDKHGLHMLIALTAVLAALPLLVTYSTIDKPLSAADDTACQELHCTVTEILARKEDTASCLVKVTRIGTRRASYQALLSLPNDMADEGHTLEGTGILTSVNKRKNGAALLAKSILFSIKDFQIREHAFGALRISPFSRENPCTAALKALFSERTDQETASLLTALFLGDTSYFSPQTNLGFQRLGLSHLSAISGMNVTLLICLFELLLRRMYLAKSLRLAVCLCALFFYLWMVGFAASALRAALMQAIAIFAFVMRRQYDLLTVLALAAYGMCLFSPFTVYSVSFWLSVAATAGILLVVDQGREDAPPTFTAELIRVQTATQNEALWRKLLAYCQIPCKRLLHICRISLTVGLGAVCATLPITVLLFGTFSPLSPLATLLCTPFVQLLLYAACFFPLICLFPPLVLVVEKTAALLVLGVQHFSSPDFMLLYVDYLPILVITVLLVFLLFLYRVLALPAPASRITCLAFIAVSALILCGRYGENRSSRRLVYQPSAAEASVTMTHEGALLYVDLSKGTYSGIGACLETVKALESTVIHHYVVTTYESGLHQRFRLLCSSVKLKTVYLPRPTTRVEEEEASRLINFLDSCRVNTVFYENSQACQAAEGLSFVYSTAADTSGNQTPLLWLNSRDHTCLYISLSRLSGSLFTLFDQTVAEADTVILTDTGTKGAADAVMRLLQFCRPDARIVLKAAVPFAAQDEERRLLYANGTQVSLDLEE